YHMIILLLTIYLKEIKSLAQRPICMPMFIAALFTVAKYGNNPCQVTGEIKKMGCRHVIKYYLALKQKEILLFGTAWLNLEGILLSKISQTQRDKYCMVSHLYRI
ncbi:LORF2 protein, partial [Crocuta crocuta]